MNKLEKLSLHSALKIKEPIVNELFFPVVSDKYICICSEYIIDSRKYNFLSEVVSLITPFLRDHFYIRYKRIQHSGNRGNFGFQKRYPVWPSLFFN